MCRSTLLSIFMVGFVVATATATADAREPAGGPRIVNGLYTSDYPTVGALLSGSSVSAADLGCSGTMIGCSTFLTAAHCVCSGGGPDCQPGEPGAPSATGYFVFLQHAGVFAVSSIAVPPDYDFPVADVAVITLASPVTGFRPTPIHVAGSPANGTPGTIVGFGRQGDFVDDYGLKRVGNVTTAPCTTASNVTSVCWDFDNPVGPPGTDSNTCNGDSGGPLFVAGSCGATVAGITSGGTSGECTPTDSSYDANVFYYRSYIQGIAGADLSNVACGVLPQVGEAGTTVDGFVGMLSSGSPDATHSFAVGAGLAELRVTMNGQSAADFDLYVRAGAPPTTATFDCKDDGLNQFADCVIANPAAGTWYLLAHRVTGAGVYQATATTFAVGPPGPGGGGPCDDGNACTTADVCSATLCGGTAVADGTPCNDASVCTGSDACAAGACAGVATPLPGCTLPSAAKGAELAFKDAFDGRKDRAKLSWAKGDAPSASLGDPTVGTSYHVCVFDESGGTPAVAFAATVPAGAGWSATGSGFKYRDKTGSAGGITGIGLKASSAGKARLKIDGKGSGLVMPGLPFAQDSTARFQISNGGACWQADFGTHVKNDVVQFKAKSD